jgi:hypothetical protein
MGIEGAIRVFVNDYTLDDRMSRYGILSVKPNGEDIIITLDNFAFKDELPDEYFGYDIKCELKNAE